MPTSTSKLSHTLNDFTETFRNRSSQELFEIKKLTSKFKEDELVAKEIAAATRHIEEKKMRGLVTSQPIIRKQYDDDVLAAVDANSKAFGAARTTIVYPPSALNSKQDQQGGSTSEQEKKDFDLSFSAKSLIMTSHFPVFQYPFSLIHVHRYLQVRVGIVVYLTIW